MCNQIFELICCLVHIIRALKIKFTWYLWSWKKLDQIKCIFEKYCHFCIIWEKLETWNSKLPFLIDTILILAKTVLVIVAAFIVLKILHKVFFMQKSFFVNNCCWSQNFDNFPRWCNLYILLESSVFVFQKHLTFEEENVSSFMKTFIFTKKRLFTHA